MEIVNVAIIGGGPAGLFCAFECRIMGLNCVLIDALENLGGQCSALYPDKEILDIPGLPRILARNLIASLIDQAEEFTPKYLLGHKVISAAKSGNTWRIHTGNGKTVVCKSVVIATGGGAFEFNKIPLLEASQFEGTSLFYAVKNKREMQDKTVSIIGGGDAALDWAIALADVAKKINLIHRRDIFKATPISLKRLKPLLNQGKVQIFTPFQLSSMNGHSGQLTSIALVSSGLSKNEAPKRLDTDVLLAFFGLAASRNKFESWEINVENGRIPVDKATYMTNQSLVYAIGDAALYDGKITSILSAFAEGAIVSRSIHKYLGGIAEVNTFSKSDNSNNIWNCH
ncbi:MAG: NAD(P)/FAD-dependent oxidoreductase [Holosporales bacterium]|jgi:thioredoxin reductase (NADPH)|nr:NAD(P)/FAD-dependent oxidoreductase [Holosporales bacterium]